MRPPASGGIACTDSYCFLPHNIPGAWRWEGRHATVPRSIVSPLYAVLPLQGGALGAITGGAQIGTFGVHEVEPWEALIGRGGAKQRPPAARAGPLPHDPAVAPARRAHPPREQGRHRDHEQKPHQGAAPGMPHHNSEDFERLLESRYAASALEGVAERAGKNEKIHLPPDLVVR